MSSLQECIKMANDAVVCYFATTEGDQPRVRPLMIWYAAENGFWFQSQSVKALYNQLEKNPKCEFCFFHDEKVLRVYGTARIITDEAIRAKCIRERPFVERYGITGPSDPLLAVFHVYTGECYIWNRTDTMKEAQIPRIKF